MATETATGKEANVLATEPRSVQMKSISQPLRKKGECLFERKSRAVKDGLDIPGNGHAKILHQLALMKERPRGKLIDDAEGGQSDSPDEQYAIR